MNRLSTISIFAPDPIADFILKQRLWSFYEQSPRSEIILNPSQHLKADAAMHLRSKPFHGGAVRNRKVGLLTEQTYQHKVSCDRSILPDIVAGLDPNLIAITPAMSKIKHDLWLSFDPASFHITGFRQALDWVESCIHSLSWLNDPQPTSAPLSQPECLR